MGHSTLQRLVVSSQLPLLETEMNTQPINQVSIDGGKICLRGKEHEGGQWRDYKLVSFHHGGCEAFFQDPDGLLRWIQKAGPKVKREKLWG